MTPLHSAPPVCFILTPNRDRARQFYTDTLGLKETAEEPFAITYDLGGTLMRLTPVEDYAPHPHTVLGWEVADIEATIDALVARGVAFAMYDGFDQDARAIWTAPDGRVRLAWFHDPDGNNLLLSQHA